MKCVKCGRRAAFISPLGTMCPTDALLAAVFHDWIPEQVRPEDRMDALSVKNAFARVGKSASDPAHAAPRTWIL